jgi:hypothetical protein
MMKAQLITMTLVLGFNASSALARDTIIKEKNGFVVADYDGPGVENPVYVIDVTAQICFFSPSGGINRVYRVPCESLARRSELRPYIVTESDNPPAKPD